MTAMPGLIGDVFPTSEGSNLDEMQAAYNYQLDCLHEGTAGLWIPLNGGSDTRRSTREYWREYALRHNVGFESSGCHILIGGRA